MLVVYPESRAAAFVSVFERMLKGLGELLQRDSNCPTEGPKLYQVDPALATLTLADERLRFTNPLGKLDLGEASTPARPTKYFQKRPVLFGMNRLLHCASRRNGLS